MLKAGLVITIILLPILAVIHLYINRLFIKKIREIDSAKAEVLCPGFFRSTAAMQLKFQAFVFMQRYKNFGDQGLSALGDRLRMVNIIYLLNFIFVVILSIMIFPGGKLTH